METLQKKNNWLKKTVLFLVACVLLSALLKVGAHYYFGTYWTPGLEKNILDKCISDSKNNAEEGVSEEKITTYCNCNLEKIKTKYQPKELSTINNKELEDIANECIELIK